MTDALKDFLTDFVRGQEAVRRATVAVERERHPTIAGLFKDTLTGHSREAVQGIIDERTRLVEEHPQGGFAQFLTPYKLPDGRWRSTGEVMLYPAQGEAA